MLNKEHGWLTNSLCEFIYASVRLFLKDTISLESSGSQVFLPLLPHSSLSPEESDLMEVSYFELSAPKPPFFLHTVQLWVSVLAPI